MTTDHNIIVISNENKHLFEELNGIDVGYVVKVNKTVGNIADIFVVNNKFYLKVRDISNNNLFFTSLKDIELI